MSVWHPLVPFKSFRTVCGGTSQSVSPSGPSTIWRTKGRHSVSSFAMFATLRSDQHKKKLRCQAHVRRKRFYHKRPFICMECTQPRFEVFVLPNLTGLSMPLNHFCPRLVSTHVSLLESILSRDDLRLETPANRPDGVEHDPHRLLCAV